MPYSKDDLVRLGAESSYCANFMARTKSWAMSCGFQSPQHLTGYTRLGDIGLVGNGTSGQCAALRAMLQKQYPDIDLTDPRSTLTAVAKAQYAKQR